MAAFLLPSKIQHFNLEAASMDDVAAAYARCRKLGSSRRHPSWMPVSVAGESTSLKARNRARTSPIPSAPPESTTYTQVAP